ncbi:MAG: hypothetical protein LC793_18530 [Thermomicrobia bacterium]|nr:hypothetical protein [Thermomicrobia bacterium]
MTPKEIRRQVEIQLRIAIKAMEDAERDHLPCTRDRAYTAVLQMLEEE